MNFAKHISHSNISRSIFQFISILFLLIFYKPSAGQQIDSVKAKLKDKQPYLNVLKTNPLPVLFGTIPLTSEYRVVMEYVTGTQISSQIGLSYLGKNVFIRLFDSVLTNSGFRFQATFKFYLNSLFYDLNGWDSKNYFAPNGLYVAPHLSYASAKLSTDYANSVGVYLRCTQFNVAMLVGYQMILFDILAIDAFSGIGYKHNEWVEYRANQTNVINLKQLKDIPLIGLYASPVKIYLGFNVGIVY